MPILNDEFGTRFPTSVVRHADAEAERARDKSSDVKVLLSPERRSVTRFLGGAKVLQSHTGAATSEQEDPAARREGRGRGSWMVGETKLEFPSL